MGRIKVGLGKVFSGKALFRVCLISFLCIIAGMIVPGLETKKHVYEPDDNSLVKFEGITRGAKKSTLLAGLPEGAENLTDQPEESLEIAQVNLPYKSLRRSMRTEHRFESSKKSREESQEDVDTKTEVKQESETETETGKAPESDKESGTDNESEQGEKPDTSEEEIKALEVRGMLRTDYCVGSTVPLKEIEVYAVREGKEKELITAEMYIVEPYDTAKAGNFELIITYGGESATLAFGVREYSANLELNGGLLNTSKLSAYDYQLPVVEEPIRDGFIFTGWYLDAECTEYVDLNTYRMPVGTTEINLYAGWIEESDFLIDADGMLSEYHASDMQDGGFVDLPREDCIGIRASAFVNNWQGIYDLCIPGNIEYIEPGALKPLKELWWIFVEDDNPNYAAVDGVLYSKDLSTLIHYPAEGSIDFRIPDCVTAIENHAMSMVAPYIERVYFTSMTPPELLLNGEAYFRGLCRSDAAGGAVQIQLYVPAEAKEQYEEAFSHYYFSPEDEAAGITLSAYILVEE